MSAKNMIQNLQDSQLIRIFLDFVQTYHLQYQKIDKEISYKCHQATWILASTKATGYGRTQSQAYKHALRNLLQILIQDPPYRQFFANLLTPNQNSNTNSSANTNTLANCSYSKLNQSGTTNMRSQNLNNKQKPVAPNNNKSQLYSHLSASLASNPSNTNVTNKRQLKTQAMQPQQQSVDLDKYNQMGTGHQYQKYDMGNKMAINSKGSYASSYKCMGYQGYQPYPQSSSTSKKQSYSKTNMTNMNTNNINNSNYQASGQTSQSSLIMHKQSYPQQTSNTKQKNINNYQQQLKQALVRNKQLCEQLDKINKQNEMLRNKIYTVGRQNKNNSSVNNLNISASHHNINQNSNNGNNGQNGQNNKGMRLSVGGHHHNTSATYLQTGVSHTKAYSHTNINLNTSTHSNVNNTPNVSIMNASNTINSIQKIKNNTNSQNTSTVIPTSTHLNIMRDITNNMNTAHHAQTQQDKNTGNMNSEQSIKPRPSISTNKSKVQVPKLKLQILPNYHKKAQKSLNDSLLAVYQQKHGVTHTSGDITGVSSMVGGINVNVSVNNFKKVI